MSKKKTAVNKGIQTLTELIDYFKIQEWDVLIIGDGSGCGWQLGAGWSSVLIDHWSGARALFYGSMNKGTIMLGEMLPYLHALIWYTGTDGPGKQRRLTGSAHKRIHIHCVTDSQAVVTAGNYPDSRRSHRPLWAAFDEYRKQGYELHFHYAPRDLLDLNVLTDEVSRQARLDTEETFARAVTKLQKRYPGLPEQVTIYDFQT